MKHKAGGTSLGVQWLRLCAPIARSAGSILVGELRSHMLHDAAPKKLTIIKKKKYKALLITMRLNMSGNLTHGVNGILSQWEKREYSENGVGTTG